MTAAAVAVVAIAYSWRIPPNQTRPLAAIRKMTADVIPTQNPEAPIRTGALAGSSDTTARMRPPRTSDTGRQRRANPRPESKSGSRNPATCGK